MNRVRLFILAVPLMLAACSTVSNRETTIATLRDERIEIKEERIEGGLEKAMLSYQHFLEETSDSDLTPEALRRLADLKIEKEYGTLTEGAEPAGQATALPAPERIEYPAAAPVANEPSDQALASIAEHGESEAEFESRTTRGQPPGSAAAIAGKRADGASDLERAGTREAIAL